MSDWIKRKDTKSVDVGGVIVGAGNPIAVQSMTNTNTCDVLATVKQINDLQAAGADIVRVSVPGFDEAAAFKEIRKAVDIPLVADIHFDYKIALEVADSADCLRINPGNIGKENKVREVIQAAIHNNVPIRVGVNAGSMEKDLQKKYLSLIDSQKDLNLMEEVRVSILGKKGELSLKMRELGTMSPDEKQSIGPVLNNLRNEVTDKFLSKKYELEEIILNKRLETEWIDLSLPSRTKPKGSIHPISQVTEEVSVIFSEMGFSVAEGPQIETDWYNFDALNIPPEHPARQEHDTFFLHREKDDIRAPNVLRTHTSPVQIRHMISNGAPCRIIAPGRVYRCDYDQTHTPMFHQLEGLAIDKNISMANLKGTLEVFCKKFFEVNDIELRFRASHFPFTEPSAEVDLRCSWKDGKLEVGKGDSWMEILGSGMVHPKVLDAGGIDSRIWQGFAFGMGIDRLAMLKYGIPDLRAFFDSDLRWLRHYGFSSLDQPNSHTGLTK